MALLPTSLPLQWCRVTDGLGQATTAASTTLLALTTTAVPIIGVLAALSTIPLTPMPESTTARITAALTITMPMVLTATPTTGRVRPMVRAVDLLPGAMDLAVRPAIVVARPRGVMDPVVPQGIGEAQPLGVMDPAVGMGRADARVPFAANLHT